MRRLIPKALEGLNDNVLYPDATKVSAPPTLPKIKIIKGSPTDSSFSLNMNTDTLDDIKNKSNLTIYTFPEDKYVLEFFESDVSPRLQRETGANLSQANIAANIYKTIPIVPEQINPTYAGFAQGGRYLYNYDNDLLGKASKFINGAGVNNLHIAVNPNYAPSRGTLIHELTHAYRLGVLGHLKSLFSNDAATLKYDAPKFSNYYAYGSGYNSKEKNYLSSAYDMSNYDLRSYEKLYETGATNTEIRFKLWRELYKKLGRKPTLNETDTFINSYDPNKLKNIIKNINDYGNQMYRNGINPGAAKKALIHVAENNTNKDNSFDNDNIYTRRTGYNRCLEKSSC